MDEGQLARILRECEATDLLTALVDKLSPTDLGSLLLEVSKRRAARVTPAEVLRRYQSDRFVKPSAADPASIVELDRLAFSLAAPAFLPLELSPVCPLGTVASLGSISQNKVVSTMRFTEVVADSTNVMALECALRRRYQDVVRLCASHRLLRAQPLIQPASFAHFRVFALCSAGRDEGAHRFEVRSLVDHLRVYLKILHAFKPGGRTFAEVRVLITPLAEGIETLLTEQVLAPLSGEFPEVPIDLARERQSGRGYYQTTCLDIRVRDDQGKEHSVADGGFTDWTAKLLSDRKERLLISGLGTERLCYLLGTRRH